MPLITMPHGLDPRRKTDQPALCSQCEGPIPDEHDDEIAAHLGTCLETACKLAQIAELQTKARKWEQAEPVLESAARIEVSDSDETINRTLRLTASLVRESARRLLEWRQCATCKRRIVAGRHCWEHDPQHDAEMRWQRG